jgi:hypothetical protein
LFLDDPRLRLRLPAFNDRNEWTGVLSLRRHEPLQLLEPVLDEDQVEGVIGSVGPAGRFYDEEALPVWRPIVVAKQTAPRMMPTCVTGVVMTGDCGPLKAASGTKAFKRH